MCRVPANVSCGHHHLFTWGAPKPNSSMFFSFSFLVRIYCIVGEGLFVTMWKVLEVVSSLVVFCFRWYGGGGVNRFHDYLMLRSVPWVTKFELQNWQEKT